MCIRFPKLFHINDEQLYIKTNPDGIATLNEAAMPSTDSENKNKNNHNSTLEESKKSPQPSKSSQPSQPSQPPKLSRKERKKVDQLLYDISIQFM